MIDEKGKVKIECPECGELVSEEDFDKEANMCFYCEEDDDELEVEPEEDEDLGEDDLKVEPEDE